MRCQSRNPLLVQASGSDPLQFGELRLPEGSGPFPVAVIIHGGCWTQGYATARNTALLASALTAKGIATWYIEYRVVGDKGGGWPGTFLGWGSAVDHLRALAKAEPIDLSHVVAVGHLAGALAAFWSRLVTNCRRAVKFVEDPLPVQAAVAINGPGDIAAMIGADVNVCDLRALPLGVPQYFVASKVLSTEAANTLLGSGYRKRRHGRDPRRRQW